MVAALGVLFVLVPIVELAVLVMVAGEIGVLNALGLLVLFSFVGAWVCKREGMAVFRRMQQTLAEGNMPHKEVIDGFLILLGGALLLVPGFVTDAFGVLLLLPPVRIAVRTMLLGSFRKRGAVAIRIVDGFGGVGGLRGRAPGGVHDVASRDVGSRDVEPRPSAPPELPS